MTAEKQCIVIVEDEPDILDMVTDVLELEGFDVIAFNRPFDPSTLRIDPDLFVVDLMLPGQSGIELAKRLRWQGFRSVPMIAMSASSKMLRAAEQSGLFQALLAKPFDLLRLLQMIETHLPA